MAEEFQVTAEEVDKISKALKNEEFRKLFFDYAREISDPENKQKYEAELVELENRRGVDLKFIKPTAGFVIKSLVLPEGKEKLFVNVCTNKMVGWAESSSTGTKGQNWQIPYSLTPPRDDHDHKKNKCTVADVMFHPETYNRGQQSQAFKQLLIDTALDGIEENYNIKVDRSNIKHLKMAYKGIAPSAVIRVPKDEVTDRPENVDLGGLPLTVPYPPLKNKAATVVSKPSQPKYTVVHRGEFSMQDYTHERQSSVVRRPQYLVVSIHLPGVQSAASVELDILDKSLTLECPQPAYKLDLALSYPVNSDEGSARFDKSNSMLTVTLPVLPPPVADVQPVKQLVTELQPREDTKLQTNDTGEETELQNSDTGADRELEPNNNGEDAANVEDESEMVDKPQSCAVEDWCSAGEWSCPPFTYKQDDSIVSFVLHTPAVSQHSMVANFDKNTAQLAYKTASGGSYSFYCCFDAELEPDDCVVDVSDENVLLMLTKDQKAVWEKFKVGLNSSQTTEKLFLTESNVMSALEELRNFPDPWAGGEELHMRVLSHTESQLDLEFTTDKPDVDEVPAKSTEGMLVTTNAEKPVTTNQEKLVTTNEEKPVTTDEEKPVMTNKELPVATNEEKPVMSNKELPVTTDEEKPVTTNKELPVTTDEEKPATTNEEQLAMTVQEQMIGSKNSSDQTLGESDHSTSQSSEEANFMKVNDDGSLFLRADADYMKNRAELMRGTASQLSNKLMYSLD